MAKIQLRTFKDLIDKVCEQLKIQTQDVESRRRIKRNINTVYLDEVVPFKRWQWLRDLRNLQVEPYYFVGTAAVEQNSVTVTLSNPPSTSKAGFYFSAYEGGEVYRILAHVAGSATVILENPYSDVTQATTGYRIWTDSVPLPVDCKEVVEVTHQYMNRPLENMGIQELRRLAAGQPKTEGRPAFYSTGPYRDPEPYSAIPGMPASVSRSSNGLVKTVTFASDVPSVVQPGSKINIALGGSYTYNGEMVVSSIDGSSLTYTGTVAHTETTTADISGVVQLRSSQGYEAYRDLILFPALSDRRTILAVDYQRNVEPMENDSDEPIIPIEDRIVLFYGAMWLSCDRERNPEWANQNYQLFQAKLSRMAGKTEDSPDKPIMKPSNLYLSGKRYGSRKRDLGGLTSGWGGTWGVGGGSAITGTANTIAVFNEDGNLVGSDTIIGTFPSTALAYDNATSGLTATNIQAAVDEIAANEASLETQFESVFNALGVVQDQIDALPTTYQPLDADLTALAAMSTTGMLARTAANTYTTRTVTGTTNQITVTNGDGVSGNPTLAVADNPRFSGTAGMVIPAGNTAQRDGAPAVGEIRYNSQTGSFEGYSGSGWGGFGGGGGSADLVSYDNATSGLTATNVQDALDETVGLVDTAQSDIDAHEALTSGAHGVTGNVVGTSDSQTLTNKTISGSSNTITNIGDSSIASGIDAAKIGAGTVSNTEFGYLDGVTSAIQTQIAAKAPLASPTFTGTPAAPTATAGTNTTQLATTAFVTTAVAGVGNAITALTGDVTASGPGSVAATIANNAVTTAKILDANVTTAKIADANVTDAKVASGIDAAKIGAGAVSNTEFSYLDGVTSAIQTQFTAKAPLASPALTGTPTAPTATAGTNSTQIATTAYVDTGLALKANLASPTFTGTPAAPTATGGTNTTQIATTAFVTSAIAAAPALNSYYWSGYHDVNYAWSKTGSTFGDMTIAGTGTFTQLQNSGFGTVTTAASSLPGISFTPPATGKYYVSVVFSGATLPAAYRGFRLTDGTNVMAECGAYGDTVTHHLSGILSVSSVAAMTLKIQCRTSANTSYIQISTATGANAIQWTIFSI